MICKTFRGGKSARGGTSHINYLLNNREHEGTAKCVYGNPNLTKKIINQIENEYKYTAGVMRFKETISAQQRDEIIEEFKKTFFCGLEEKNYNLLIVEHTDKNSTELHFVIPKIELKSGLAYNPYYEKRDFKKKDLFQDYINTKYGFESHWENQNLMKINTSSKNDIQAFLDTFVKEELEKGTINNAKDLKSALLELGFSVNRQGKNYIGLEINGQKLRMKGTIYGKDFRGVANVAREQKEIQQRHINRTSEGLRKVEQELRKIIKCQAKTNQEKYSHKWRDNSIFNTPAHSSEHTIQSLEHREKRENSVRQQEIYTDRSKQNNMEQRQDTTILSTQRRLERDDSIRDEITRTTRARARRKREREQRITYLLEISSRTASYDTRRATKEFTEYQEQSRRFKIVRGAFKRLFEPLFRRISEQIEKVTKRIKNIELLRDTIKQQKENPIVSITKEDLRRDSAMVNAYNQKEWDSLVDKFGNENSVNQRMS